MLDPTPQNDPARRPAIGLLVLVWAWIYGRYAVGFTPSGIDVVNSYFPNQFLVQQTIRSGSLPYWNTMTFSGRPLLADIQIGFFYPPNWLHWMLPLGLSFAWLLALHGALMFAGCWRLGRAFGLKPVTAALGTILFCASPFFLLKFSQGTILFIYGCAWWPWIALAVSRLAAGPNLPRLAMLAICLALALLAGAPQMAFYGWGLALALGLVLPLDPEPTPALPRWLRRTAWLAAAFVAALGLAAIQILPTAYFVGHSLAREGQEAWEYITADSFSPGLFWLFLNPGMLGLGHDPGLYFEPTMDFAEGAFYLPLWVWAVLIPCAAMGCRSVAMTPTRKRIAVLAGLAIVGGALLAMGRFSPIFSFAYAWIPGFDMFRVTARMMLLAVTGIAVLAALGLDAILAENRERSRGFTVALTLGTVAALAAVWIAFAMRDAIWLRMENPVMMQGGGPVAAPYRLQSQNALLHGVGASIALVLAALVITRMNARTGGRWALALPLLAACELVLLAAPFVRDVYFTRYQSTLYPRTPLVEMLAGEHREGRILWLDDVIGWVYDQNHEEIFPNRLIMHGLPDARGYDPISARWYATWCNLLAGNPALMNPQAYMLISQIARPAWLPLMGVETVLSYEDLSALPGLREVAHVDFPAGQGTPPGRIRLYRNEAYWGLAWAARPAQQAAGWMESMMIAAGQAMEQPGDPRQSIIGEGAPLAGAPSPVDARFKVEAHAPQELSPSQYAFQVDFPEPAMLCFSQSVYPGWAAKVDGEWNELQLMSGAFMMTPVPAGRHEVIFDYQPEGFAAGRMITLLTLAAFGYGFARRRVLRARG